MNYEQTIEKIYSLLRFGSQPGLDRLKVFMDRLGNPQKKLKFIHIAGTNGKGSTSTFIASILSTQGYKTGLFTSPYVICFRERIQIDFNMISENDLISLVDKTFPILEDLQKEGIIITEFEYITALAFLYFSEKNCDYVVLEVGLGGRFDATNIIESPLVSVITSISLDHTSILGNTLEEVAREKAGIIKPLCPVVFTSQEEIVNKVFFEKASSSNSKIYLSDFSKEIKYKINNNFLCFKLNNLNIKSRLLGEYQIYNICNSIKAIEVLKKNNVQISDKNILKGIENAFIPARFEIIKTHPLLIIDGAHNPDGMKKLYNTIKMYLPDKNLIGITGMLKDKNIDSSLEFINRVFNKIICVEPNSPRKLDSNEMCIKCMNICDDVYDLSNDYEKALFTAYKFADSNSAIIVFGSLYLASEIRNILKKY